MRRKIGKARRSVESESVGPTVRCVIQVGGSMLRDIRFAALLIGASALFGSTAVAELRVARIFADHVVLQRDRPVRIWGSADAGDEVTVEFAGVSKTTAADATGAWSATFDPLQAANEGKPLRVVSGEEAIVVEDVVIGEVWHASGQSNMAMTLGDVAASLDAAKADLAAADLPAIRFCRIDEGESREPLDDLRRPAVWSRCSPTSATGFSAAAFYFARDLQAKLGVPVGIVDSSRGGTPIEPFIPREAFDAHPTLRKELELGDRDDLAGLWKMTGGVQARDANWLPGRLFNARLHPIRRFAVRGAIWYQGESNSGHREDPRDYQHKMRALIEGWRTAFGDEAMPVYFVQLPGSGAGPGWPYLREQQRLAADLPHTGMVVTIDLQGAGIHPSNKIDVGKRLARWALANDYRQNVACSGPTFDRQTIEGDTITLRFRHAESGLMAASKEGLDDPQETPGAELTHFEALSSKGDWLPAKATIVGHSVVVACPDGSSPIAVRYAYAVTPEGCNLYNRDGLPASPFCTRPELLEYDPNLPK